jgi:hypothetical protein
VLTNYGIPEEPEFKTVVVRQKAKIKEKRKADLAGIETIVEPAITIAEERLTEGFINFRVAH